MSDNERERLITGLGSGPVIAPARPRQEFYEQSLAQKHELGARYVLEDGRVFRYSRAGASALVAGEVQQSAAFGGSVATVQHDLTPSAAAVGARRVSFTSVTDAITINQFARGYLAVSDGGAAIGQGEMYGIVGNAAGAAGALVFELDRGLTTVWTSSTRVSIMTNPYNLVIQAPATTPTGLVVGVAMLPVSINYYCWLQTWGMANVLIATATTMGSSVILDLGAAGSAGVTAGSESEAVIGIAGIVSDTGDSGFIFLQISP